MINFSIRALNKPINTREGCVIYSV